MLKNIIKISILIGLLPILGFSQQTRTATEGYVNRSVSNEAILRVAGDAAVTGYVNSVAVTFPAMTNYVTSITNDTTTISMSNPVAFPNGLKLNNQLIDNTTNKLGVSNLTFDGSIVPTSSNTFNLGSLEKPWKDLFLGPDSIYMAGQKVLSYTNGSLNISGSSSTNDNSIVSYSTMTNAIATLVPVVSIPANIAFTSSNNVYSSGTTQFMAMAEVTNNATSVNQVVNYQTMTNNIASGNYYATKTEGVNGSLFTQRDYDYSGSVVAWGLNDYGQIDVPSAASNNVIATGGGLYHSIALKSDGSVVAWGRNNSGQIDIPPSASNGVIAIASGSAFVLALKSDGGVIAWGANGDGQCNVPSLASNGVIAIAGGSYHSLALRYDGRVLAWGYNNQGQRDVPSSASNNVVAIAAGNLHNLALRSDGSVVAWGLNNWGQLDVPASASNNVIAIAAGYFSSMALKSDGSVIAWGFNGFGQCNVPSSASNNVIAIDMGYEHCLALKSDGKVITWGSNSGGQCDVPASASNSVYRISTGEYAYHSLAIRGTRTLGDTTLKGNVRVTGTFLSDGTATNGTEIVNYQTMTNKIESYNYVTSTITNDLATTNYVNDATNMLWTATTNFVSGQGYVTTNDSTYTQTVALAAGAVPRMTVVETIVQTPNLDVVASGFGSAEMNGTWTYTGFDGQYNTYAKDIYTLTYEQGGGLHWPPFSWVMQGNGQYFYANIGPDLFSENWTSLANGGSWTGAQVDPSSDKIEYFYTTNKVDSTNAILSGSWKVDHNATNENEIVNYQTMTNHIDSVSNSLQLAINDKVATSTFNNATNILNSTITNEAALRVSGDDASTNYTYTAITNEAVLRVSGDAASTNYVTTYTQSAPILASTNNVTYGGDNANGDNAGFHYFAISGLDSVAQTNNGAWRMGIISSNLTIQVMVNGTWTNATIFTRP